MELLQEGYPLQVVLPDLAFVNLVAASLQQLMKYHLQLIKKKLIIKEKKCNKLMCWKNSITYIMVTFNNVGKIYLRNMCVCENINEKW